MAPLSSFSKAVLVLLLFAACDSSPLHDDPYGKWCGDYEGGTLCFIVGPDAPNDLIGWAVRGDDRVGFSGSFAYSGDQVAIRFFASIRATTLNGTRAGDSLELWGESCAPCPFSREPTH